MKSLSKPHSRKNDAGHMVSDNVLAVFGGSDLESLRGDPEFESIINDANAPMCVAISRSEGLTMLEDPRMVSSITTPLLGCMTWNIGH
jgi:hypothetical protein